MIETYISHTGVAHDDDPPGRGSGRYGWGTGENPNQHQFDLISEVARLKSRGLKEAEIAKMFLGEKAKAIDLRAELTIEKNRLRRFNHQTAVRLLEECNGNVSEVARKMGRNESTIRSFLDPIKADRMDRYEITAEVLKKRIQDTIDADAKGMIDISSGTELFMGVPKYTKDVAIRMLQKEGYLKSWVNFEQVGTGNETTMIVLAPPGTTHGDIQRNKYNIASVMEYTPDKGKTWWTPEFPENLDSKRVMVRYAEEGGKEKDGVIELRRGVEDISLGGAQYSQVRIAVDGTNYLKGMAMYAEDKDFPKGVDVIYNTNKKVGVPLIDKSAVYNPEDGTWSGKEVAKRLKIDKATGEVDRDNPFGALIKAPKERDGVITPGGQRHYIDSDGKEKLSPINKLQDEGDWDSWSRTLSSQFLAKQPIKLIKQQLDLSVDSKKVELDEILALTNPVVKKKMLEEYASGCDANAADLSAKGVKDQAFQVLLPIPSIKPNEVYAPNYETGETVALVRYPHGGTFEIPILTVNNKVGAAKKVMRNASDAIGIHPEVAERLSGADFDGDTALVIPMSRNKIKVTSTKSLEELENFEPKELYKLPDSAPQMKSATKQNEMGKVTNLITDMTVAGAPPNEICRAVKHSMVVIDAEKHHLDYRKSEKDNNIAALKKEYQTSEGKERPGGATTILSRAKSKVRVEKRKEVTDTSKMTPEELERWNEGKKVYRKDEKKRNVYTEITDPSDMTESEYERWSSGKKVLRVTGETSRLEKVHQMDLVDDARDLVRDKTNAKEMAYANYANELKALANKARKTSRNITPIPVNQSARKTYAEEVTSLNEKLTRAEMNSPLERRAQLIANGLVSEKRKSNPDMDFEHIQRAKAVALTQARAMVGAKKDPIVPTDREWEAIQAHALSSDKVRRIINNMKDEDFKKRSTPKQDRTTLTPNQLSLAKSMYNSGMYTQKEIADRLGVSASAVSNAIRNS